MSAGDILRASEASALDNVQFVSRVVGKKLKRNSGLKKGSFSAMIMITLVIAVAAVLFGSGNLIPSAISERLIEETDVQYADAVESKIIVFRQAMLSGSIPNNTINRLLENGVSVVSNGDGSQSLMFNNEEISYSNFVEKIHDNAGLYNAFTKATYGRAAYYYDDSAMEVFRRLGSSRNNYTKDSDFNETMSKLMGDGSNINVNGVSIVKKTRTESGNTITYYEYVNDGPDASSSTGSATGYIGDVANKTRSGSSLESTLAAAETLSVADTISKEQRSSIFYLGFMENISKMKAGLGGESKITDAMNLLSRSVKTQAIDPATGEIIEFEGSMLESPSLYAVLSGQKVKTDNLSSFSSERILTTVENKVGASAGEDILRNTVTSANTKTSGSIGRINTGNNIADATILNATESVINSSLFENSFATIGGINGGEMLVEGAVNVGKELAKASGASASSDEAAKSYARLTSKILALDAEVDRMNRSPFDITSKNTFLGSLFYKLAVSVRPTGFLSVISALPNSTISSAKSLLPSAVADDETERYLNNYGDCKKAASIGAVGTLHCSEVVSFDTSTLDNPYSDASFIDFLNKNTSIDGSGNRTINKNSSLANYIKYNNRRITPIGVTDGGILSSLILGTDNITVISSAAEMVKNFLNTTETNKRIATGAAFVNSASNPDWQTYKYAQRYISLARAAESLRQYADDETAYSNIPYLEGTTNPVVAFINQENNLASK